MRNKTSEHIGKKEKKVVTIIFLLSTQGVLFIQRKVHSNEHVGIFFSKSLSLGKSIILLKVKRKSIDLTGDGFNNVDYYPHDLTLSPTTNLRLFQTGRVGRRQF